MAILKVQISVCSEVYQTCPKGGRSVPFRSGGQRHILYITGRTKRDAARSPYIEAGGLEESSVSSITAAEESDRLHRE